MPSTPSNRVNIIRGRLTPVVVLGCPAIKVNQELFISNVDDGCHGSQCGVQSVLCF